MCLLQSDDRPRVVIIITIGSQVIAGSSSHLSLLHGEATQTDSHIITLYVDVYPRNKAYLYVYTGSIVGPFKF